MHKQSFFIAFAILTTSTYTHSADLLCEANIKKAGNFLERGTINQRDVLIFLRLLPVLICIPQYNLRNYENINRFNKAAATALKALPNEANLNQSFIFPTGQESNETLSDLKKTNLPANTFIQSLQAPYCK